MGSELVERISALRDTAEIEKQLSATFEFQQLLRFENSFPSDHYYDTSASLNKIRIEGAFLEVRELFDLRRSIGTIRAITGFFRQKEEKDYPVLKSICSDIKHYPYISDAADRIIDKDGKIKDSASPGLKEIRNGILQKGILVSRRLASILKQAQVDGIVDADTVVSVRNGRGVIPVNAFHKRKLNGLVHDQSASGKTVFIEPAEVVQLNNEIVELEHEERREIVRILISFSDDIRPYIDDLLIANSFLGEIDFLRAKAILGNQLGSIKPALSTVPVIRWRKAIHPLLFLTFKKLKDRKVVPLDIVLENDSRILLISGPNAGGKSVCLKTVGLLQYMLQCGITIPVGEGSESGIFRNIFIDIGDEQSIENDLSTYSSHLINMKFFIRNASADTLVLIDEFGTGTEPMLGGAIAEAILEELNRSGCFGVLTTHYTNLKHYASLADGVTNGAMLFDHHLMQPLFQLSIGKPGSSFAFEIARKIGLPEEILKQAGDKAGVKNINYDRNLKDIARDKRYWETKRQRIRQEEKRLEELIEQYDKELDGIKSLRKEILLKAKEEAGAILDESNRLIENTIRVIKETQAEKEKTRAARQELDRFRESLSAEIEPVDDKLIPKPELEKIAGKFRKRQTAKPLPREGDTAETTWIPGPGDPVRVVDTQAAGEIIRIEGTVAQVETGSLKIFVPLDRLEKISRSELRKSLRQAAAKSGSDPVITERKLNFKPEIDIRGYRAEEALDRVRDFLDDAVMVQHRYLRILHGKGNGILRLLVREYLGSMNVVKSYRDEHVELGGSGITVVEMDF